MKPEYEIIEKYILGELSSEELKDFKQQMKNDAEFNTEVELYKELNTTLQKKYQNLEKENNLKNTLEKNGEKYFSSSEHQNKGKNKFKISLFRVASLAAILVIGFFLLKPQTDLYTQFAEHQTLSFQEKGENNVYLIKAEKYFNDKFYNEAIPAFESYLRDNPEDPEVQISLGISLLEEDKIEDAMIIFSHIYDQNNVFKNKASWYMALSYLKKEDFKQSKAFLSEIEKGSFYYEKAQKLMKKLK